MVTHILSVPKQVNKQTGVWSPNLLGAIVQEGHGTRGDSAFRRCAHRACVKRVWENCHFSGKAAMMQGLLDVLTAGL